MLETGEIQDRSEIEQISDFKNGYLKVLESQLYLTQNTVALLSSSILTADDRQCMSDYRSELDMGLRDILKIIRQSMTDISASNLEKEAHRDYHNLFNGDASDERIAFIVFLKTYVVLKNFTMDAAQAWSNLQRTADRADFSQTSEFRRQLYNYNLRPSIRQIENINLFCSRMSKILRLKRDPLTTLKIDGLAIYCPDIIYTLSYVFTDNLESSLDILFKDHEPDKQQLGESHLPSSDILPPLKTRLPTSTSDDFDLLAPVSQNTDLDYRLDASGTQAWNRTPGYFFHYDPRLLQKEREIYRNVVYIDSHMGADQRYIKSDLIINISRRIQPTQKVDVEKEYSTFLQNFINLVVEITLMNMGIATELRYPFFFHLGPQAFFNLTIKFLQEIKTGTIHRKIQNGNMIKKHIPVELVRKTILEWWRREIITHTEFDRNDYLIYKKIAGQVKIMHKELMSRAQAEYEKIPEEERKRRSRQELFRENAMNWIGATNVVVFKRFLKKSS